MGLPVSRPALALVLALLSSSQATPAWGASEPTPSELSVARRLFDEGRAAEDAGRWREAAEKFRRATSIKDTPGMRFHLARCAEEQGFFVEALVEYDRARELIDGGVRAADVERLLADARERVRAKVALLTLRLPSEVQNVSVEVDGKPLSGSVLGVPMPINPGKHRVSAVAVGRTPFAAELDLGMGEVRQVSVDLPVATTVPPRSAPAAGPPAPIAARADSGAISTRTAVLVGEASLFAVALGTGIGFGLARSSADKRYEQADRKVLAQLGGSDPDGTACAIPRDGCAELDAARHDRERDATFSTIGYVAAGASAAAFAVTYWLWPQGEVAEVHASVSPGRFAVGLSGRF